MTRLDHPPHRSIPEAWVDETQSKDSFSRSGAQNLTLNVAKFDGCFINFFFVSTKYYKVMVHIHK